MSSILDLRVYYHYFKLCAIIAHKTTEYIKLKNVACKEQEIF